MTIGVDLGATNIRVGIIEGGVIYRKISASFPYEQSEAETIEYLIMVIKKLMNTNIKGIGIGVPSVVDAKLGIVYNATNVPSWKEVHLKDILESEFRIPVFINNDCNCFAFGERYYGEATPYHNIVGVTLGTGIGAGIIINDVLYEGINTGAGEVGSLPYLDADYESYCASRFFTKHNTTGYIMHGKAKKKDTQALKLWDDFGYHVGNLMKTILFTYDPQAIIIGGSLSKAYDYFAPSMNLCIATFPYPQTLKRIKIFLSKKEDISLLGAAALIP